ncbi:MAG: hypothetical protein R2939_21125 [Kofleriaceae bacterium]
MSNLPISRAFRSPAGAALLLAASSLTLGLGCGKDKQESTTPVDATSASGLPQVDPTLCETGGKNVITYDLNKDGQPDVWRLYKTEDEGGTKVEYMTCKQVDFDHDGRKDWVVGFGRKGVRQYEKVDMDYDGRFDLSAVYDPKTGVVAEIERDSDFDGQYDLRETYDSTGRIQGVQLDKDGNGKPDEWEQYKDGVLIAILYDDNFDGKVDRREEVPGARPKVEMPTLLDNTAESSINAPSPSPAPATP